jgi:hypothetical protein
MSGAAAPIRIALGEAEFRALVHGQVAKCEAHGRRVEVILSDIGFAKMQSAIILAILEADLKRAGA